MWKRRLYDSQQIVAIHMTATLIAKLSVSLFPLLLVALCIVLTMPSLLLLGCFVVDDSPSSISSPLIAIIIAASCSSLVLKIKVLRRNRSSFGASNLGYMVDTKERCCVNMPISQVEHKLSFQGFIECLLSTRQERR